MVGRHSTKAILSAALCGLTVPAMAETPVNADVQSEIAALRAEVAQLRQAQGDNWLNERRAEEVKGLIREVLNDADTRASLLQDGVYAGHDGSKFFLRSADDSFLMNVEGQIQVRYIINWQDDRSDEVENGFQIRRTKLGFNGHIGDPRIGYDIVLSADRDDSGGLDGDVFVDDVLVSYDITDSLEVMAGKFKLPFLRQELTSAKRQLAVDRASVTEFFTLNRAEQVQLVYSADAFRVAGSFSDGANTEHSEFSSDEDAELALTGRVDVKLAGEWDQAKDFTSWQDEDLAVFLGGAMHYEQGDEDQGSEAEYLTWTIDGSAEVNGASIFAALMGGHTEDVALTDDRDMLGFLIEGGYHVTEALEPFARWEWIDDDVDATDDFQAVTVGVNYYLKKHNAKFTADLVWLYAGDDPADNPFGASELSSGLGLRSGSSDEDDQVAIRTQFQLLF